MPCRASIAMNSHCVRWCASPPPKVRMATRSQDNQHAFTFPSPKSWINEGHTTFAIHSSATNVLITVKIGVLFSMADAFFCDPCIITSSRVLLQYLGCWKNPKKKTGQRGLLRWKATCQARSSTVNNQEGLVLGQSQSRRE